MQEMTPRHATTPRHEVAPRQDLGAPADFMQAMSAFCVRPSWGSGRQPVVSFGTLTPCLRMQATNAFTTFGGADVGTPAGALAEPPLAESPAPGASEGESVASARAGADGLGFPPSPPHAVRASAGTSSRAAR